MTTFDSTKTELGKLLEEVVEVAAALRIAKINR